jgi:Leucine-rich repeat (LRR) protein
MGLGQLQYLNISRNKITIMEKDCFSGVNNLINMDISFNNIETFDSDMFETLKKLKKLFTDSYIFCCIKHMF